MTAQTPEQAAREAIVISKVNQVATARYLHATSHFRLTLTSASNSPAVPRDV